MPLAFPVHPSSFVNPAVHDPALLALLRLPIDRHVVEYIVGLTAETVDYAMNRPSSSSGHTHPSPRRLAFIPFVEKVLTYSETIMPTVLLSLVYIRRAKSHLRIALEDWALERVFLGALIVASKYANDSSLKNVHWAMCTGVFGRRDVGRIEREFLDVVDFELSVTEDDLLYHRGALVPVKPVLSYARHTASKGTRANPIEIEDEEDVYVLMDESDDESADSDSSGSSAMSSPMPQTPQPQDDAHRHHPHDHRHSAKHGGVKHTAVDIGKALISPLPVRPAPPFTRPSRSYNPTVPSGAPFPSHPLAVQSSSSVWI